MVVSDLASGPGRVCACDSCFYEWIEAGAEDTFNRFRVQTGNVMKQLKLKEGRR